MFNRPDLSGHKIKTMKALKILSLVLFSSMIMWGCEDQAVGPVGGSIDGPLNDLTPPERSTSINEVSAKNGQVTLY